MASSDHHQQHGSPMHIGLSGNFSPEEIQELLGVMGDDHHHHGDDDDDNNDVGVVSRATAFDHADSEGHQDSENTITLTTTSGAVSTSERQPNNSSCTRNSSSGCNNQFSGCNSSGEASVTGSVCLEAKAQARSERKRSREKQRRSDVNKQFADLTRLLQKIDAEDVNEEDIKNGTSSASRLTYNPSNRVDLIGRTIVLLERLHEANKRRKTEISSLQQQLEEAKKAGEDTAAKLKEAMLAPPGQPMNKQFMMMVPMMMSADGTGATSAVPMMNPFMPQAAMPQAFCPMPAQQMSAAPVAAAAAAAPPTSASLPGAPGPAQASASSAPAPSPQVAQPMMASQPVVAAQPQPAAYPFMMPAPMAGANFIMPVPAQGHHAAMVGHHPMMTTMVHQQHQQQQQQAMQPSAHQQGTTSHDSQSHQEQKESSQSLNGGSNLAHCA